MRVHDTTTDPRYIASHPGIRSEIAVPLIVQDRVIGVLNLESERIGYFTEDHARTLSLLAPSVAIAVENARLYHEIGERERRMQEDLKAAFELQTVLLARGSAGGARVLKSRSGCGPRARSRAISTISSSTPIRTSRLRSAIRAARARPRRFTARWSTAACARSRRAAAVRRS